MAEQPRLLAVLPGLATALGPTVAAEAELTPDGDLALRVRGLGRDDPHLDRRPGNESVLPEFPVLVPIGVLPDRQEFSANWQALGHVLVASPFGGGAATILASVVAHLAARRTPADLQLRMIASPRALPSVLARLPHRLGPAVDPLDQEAWPRSWRRCAPSSIVDCWRARPLPGQSWSSS